MTTSQFTIYSSSDVGAPVLNGLSGSLITVLDACLVTGYGSKTAAGWTHPVPTESSSAYPTSGSVWACYQQPSGSKFTLFVNDGRPNIAAAGKEAGATGWETFTSMSTDVGSGGGQFPLPAQSLTDGHLQIRKSFTADSTARPWQLFADSRTFYLYILTGDGYWYPFWFGDIYSLKSFGKDYYKCMIRGREIENTDNCWYVASGGSGFSYDTFSAVLGFRTYSSAAYWYEPFGRVQAGSYIARTIGGGGISVNNGVGWDTSKSLWYWGASSNTYNLVVMMDGTLTTPNSADNALYIDPVFVSEPVGSATLAFLRGRYRGIWHLCHAGANFTDGQVISGAGDYAGRTFMVIKGIGEAAFNNINCIHLIETSATVETNDEN